MLIYADHPKLLCNQVVIFLTLSCQFLSILIIDARVSAIFRRCSSIIVITIILYFLFFSDCELSVRVALSINLNFFFFFNIVYLRSHDDHSSNWHLVVKTVNIVVVR